MKSEQNRDSKSLKAGTKSDPVKLYIRGRGPKNSRYKYWKAVDDFRESKERGFSKIMRSFFKQQAARVLEGLSNITGKGALMRYGIHKVYWGMKDDDLPDDVRQIFDMSAENQALGEVTEPYIKRVIKESGDRVFDELMIENSFDVENPMVQDAIDNLKTKIKGINETSYQRIKNLLSEGYAENWSLGDFEREIRSLYKNFAENRIPAIARTETLKAVNGGTMYAYNQGRVEKKEWIASMDANTRDTHAVLDGEVVGVNDTFNRGSVPMKYPGDPNAPASEVVNCRCAIMPVIEDD